MLILPSYKNDSQTTWQLALLSLLVPFYPVSLPWPLKSVMPKEEENISPAHAYAWKNWFHGRYNVPFEWARDPARAPLSCTSVWRDTVMRTVSTDRLILDWLMDWSLDPRWLEKTPRHGCSSGLPGFLAWSKCPGTVRFTGNHPHSILTKIGKEVPRTAVKICKMKSSKNCQTDKYVSWFLSVSPEI